MNESVNTVPAGRHSSAGTEKEKKKKKKLLLIILAFVLVAALALFGAYKLGLFDKPNESGILIGAGVKEGEIDPDTGEEVSGNEDGTGNNGKSNMTVRLNGYPVFEDGSSEGSLNIVNPSSNVLCMLVEITLDETGEKIYESGAIPPNHYVDNDKLTKVLKQGTHNATAHVTLYDPDNPDKEFNGADFNLTITVKN